MKSNFPIPAPLRGIIPPMVTPLNDRETLDVQGLECLIEHMIDGGVHGLFLLGTSGEAVSLAHDLACELIRRTCLLVAGRVPVLVGITDTRLASSIALARRSADAGAAAVVISTPYYLPLEQGELVSYVKSIVAAQPLPVFLYNIPHLTKTAYEPDTVVQLSEIPRIVGLKDSSGSLPYLQGLQQRVKREDWSFLVGTESLLADAVLTGSHGCVAGGANVDPRGFVSLFDAAVRRDLTAIASLRNRLETFDRIYRLAPGGASIIRGLKCALSCLGICGSRMASPHRACTEAERDFIRGRLDDLNISTREVWPTLTLPNRLTRAGATEPVS
jgi:4-hydroxy-tetrahydrodipicolinate synthase